MDEVVVYKLDEHGRFVHKYTAVVLEKWSNGVRLEAFFDRDDMDMGFTVFKRGDRFIEHFYTDRWYNIFAIYDRDEGALKGWYCNVCRPAVIEEMAVSCQDLALDVWVSANGEIQVLDEDEFAALALPTADKEASQKALQQVLALAQQGQLPV